MPKTTPILKIELPYIKCKTHKEFLQVVNQYIHTLVNKNKNLFKSETLQSNNIHAAKEDAVVTDKFFAPFWHKQHLGIIAYTNQGATLAKIWLQLMERNYPKLMVDFFISEQNYSVELSNASTTYQSQFWAPMRSAFFKNGFWYYNTPSKGTLIADFKGLLAKSINSFLVKNQLEYHLELINHPNYWLAIKQLKHTKKYASIGYKKKHKHQLFTIDFETNLMLPEQLHLGQAIGFGNGYFTKLKV